MSDVFWQDKRILVTGGSGFLGSYVVDMLKQRGARPEAITIPRRATDDLRLAFEDDPRKRVDEVMTADVVCCSPDTTAEEARTAMRERRIRHLPVADEEGRLVGLISIGDLNAELQASQQHTLFLLHQYIHGQV